jgi:hypothetical protein
MNVDIIQQRLQQYHCQTPLDEESAIKEITQEVILLGLSRINFFAKAEFHGGTALRILYGLRRFSEDLDFALLTPEPNFELMQYLDHLYNELSIFGYNVEIQDRSKANNMIKKAFLKDDSLGKLLLLQYPSAEKSRKKIRIKLEVDANPPLGANTCVKHLDFPFPFKILTKDLPSSFSGKMHALLCRTYLKGRDWYDFLWYVTNKVHINFVLLKHALWQVGPWQHQNISVNKNWLINELKNKISLIKWDDAANDVLQFINVVEQSSLSLWNADFFYEKVDELRRYI